MPGAAKYHPGGDDMDSFKTKITAATVCVIVVAMSIVAFLGVTALRNIGNRYADQMLLLMCETGQKNLDAYFQSVEQSVEMVSAYVESDLNGLEDEKLQAHLERTGDIFNKLVHKTNGVLTYYYRIDPAVSQNVKGFWYVANDEGIVRHEVTDISLYDTRDTSKLVWFTVPKASGKAVWLPPYFTDNLGARVFSYNVPVYYGGRFVGVVGIELDYFIVAKIVDNITLYDNGYAFINDKEGNIIYHPRMDVMTMEQPKVPEGLLSKNKFIHYVFEGVEKQAVWLPLSNGMRLNLTVPVEEINADWQRWSQKIITIFALLLGLFILIIKVLIGRILRT
ncbi:Cache domain-containing protein [Selenomonas sp. KH1T6]|nr:Cache domain-containing protein [Selenomonas ruminantium]